MGRMVDAVNPDNIGPEYDHQLALRITVLADPAGMAFDDEQGNAGPAAIATAIHERWVKGQPSVLYVNEGNESAGVQAVLATGVPMLPEGVWPHPGCYLWCADPSRNIANGRWRPYVAPVAIQDTYPGPVDISTTFGGFPFGVAGYIDGPVSAWPALAWARFAIWSPGPPPPAPPAPVPSPVVEVNVNVPVLQQGSQGEPVKAVQKLIGGLVVDGVFGPRTRDAVLNFQRAHNLTGDGIVGAHTWGSLVGNPQ